MIKRFIRDESGATVVEYGIIITTLSLVIIGGFAVVSTNLTTLWGDNNASIGSAFSH